MVGLLPRGLFKRAVVIVALLIAMMMAGMVRAEDAQRWAKLADSVFQHYTQDQGLPTSIATALAQDGDGFIWVGTEGGLARWDGYRFRNYKTDPKDPTALPDNYINALHTDPRGRLWIGTTAGGLARYDSDHDRFVSYRAGPGGLSHAGVWAIADDGHGGLWVGTYGGLDHLDPSTGKILSLHHDPSRPDSLPDDEVRAVLQDREGRLWVGTRAGLARRDVETGPFVPIPLAAPQGQEDRVVSLFEDDDRRIWVGTGQSGAYVIDPGVIDPGDVKPRPVEDAGEAGSTLRSDTIESIREAAPGEIWLGTYGDGIVVVDTRTGQTRHIGHVATLPSSLAHDTILALLRDRTGAMWIGSAGGLDRLANNDGAVLTLFGGASCEGGVTARDVFSVLPTRDGRIWLGFLGGGVQILDPANPRAGNVCPDQVQPDQIRPGMALPKAPVHAMAAEGDVVYLGTSRGLYRVDRAGTKIQPVAVPGRDPSARITSLLEDAGVLWVGGADDGLWKVSMHDGAPSLLDRWYGGRLTDQRVEVLTRGAAQDLWIGTGDGINRLDLATGAVERILPNPSDPTALAPGSVSSLLVDRAARLWVGTLGGGINVLTGRDRNGRPRFHRIGTADGLPSANVGQLLQDGQGKIWASTADGLAVIDPGSFAVRALHRAEGVAIAGYWVHSGAVTAEGELLFGGMGGLTVVRPERLKDWNYHPPVVVTDVHMGGKPVPAGRFNGAGSTEPLVLTPQANSLAVEFSALDYSAPERNRYAYRLQGYDKDWIETDATRRLAAYTNLPPGTYTLRLRGSNRDGAWTEITVDLPIKVLPAWYQTLWFRLLLAIAGVAAVAALVQLRTAYLRQRQRELEEQVEARTAEVVHQKAVAELAHRNIALLSEIGRQITASLDPEAIMDTLYRNVDKLMDASVFGIGLHRAELDLIEFSFAMELGKRYAPYTRSMKEPNQLAVWCIRNRQEVLINDLETEARRYLPQYEVSSINPEHLRLDDGSRPTFSVSMIYAPLLVMDRVLGVICVQSFRRGAYEPVHMDMLRTLASYTAVALDNADAYQELQRTQKQLVQQEKLASLGQLVAGVAHEVNTPVGVALAASTQITLEVERLGDMIASGQLRRADLTDVTTALDDLAALIARNCARAGTLIQSFKAVAADQSSDERRRFELRAYVEDVVRSLGPTLNRAHIKLVIEGTDLPKTDRSTIDSYPGALSQVVINLVSNALTHAFEPEQAGTITLRIALRDAGHVELIVRDDGKGIPPDVLPKIFDPFFTTRRGSGGTGLGLHIVHNLVTGPLGGTISVETERGSGTAFLVVLPLSAPIEKT